MERIELEVVRRNELGKGVSKRMRKEGFVPAVVYSLGKDALHLAVSDQQFRRLAHGRPATQVFAFKSNSVELDGLSALVRDIQVEPIKEKIHHIDFLQVHEGHNVAVTVPIKLTGSIDAVRQGLAFTQQLLYDLEIRCFPDAIPTHLSADISDLRPGQSLNAGDVPMPEGVKLVSSTNTTVVSVFAKNKAAAEELENKEGKTAETKDAKKAPAKAPAKK